MIDANAIADLQMLMNTGDGRQAVLRQLLQSDKFSRHRSRVPLAAIGAKSQTSLYERHRSFILNSEGAHDQPHHLQRLESDSPAHIRYARLPANIITTLDRLPQKDKAPLIDFTEGLAHRFNNIFMAVVGHLSIAMLQLDTATTAYRRLRECEELIHNTALLLRLLVDVFHRSHHAPHTLYPIDLTDHEINRLIFASDTRQPKADHAPLSQLSVHKIQMIMAAMMGRRLQHIFKILQHQTTRFFPTKDFQLRGGEHHQAMRRHLERGRAIANDLMVYANAVDMDRHPTPLNTIIKDAVRAFTSGNPTPKIAVLTGSTPICQKADATLLGRMLVEILKNAKDATPHDGEVTIKLIPEKVTACDSLITPPNARTVSLVIEDNGPGVSEHLGIRAFDPFTTWPKNRKRGLGLAVVYGIVKAHGGRIRFFNRLGGGLVLIIDLPL